jgi:calpain
MNLKFIFIYSFWLYGNWVDVVIDDRLPTYKQSKKLVLMHSNENNEFWPALLEKAYAKFYGSYEFLRGGNTSEAQEDFTGGVAEIFYLKNNIPSNFYRILEKSFEKNSLICCSMDAKEDEVEELTPQGLVKGHAYSITKIKFANIKMPKSSGKIELIRLRNPWGNEVEWKGNFSDTSRAWQFIPKAEKESLDLKIEPDGEFWMSYRDFLEHFHTVEICNLLKCFTHTTEFEFEEKRNWHFRKSEGEWKIGLNAGGCGKFQESFYTNPKFILNLDTPDAEDEDGKCSIIIALMQKNRRRLGLPHVSIGIVIYKISDDSHEFDENFFLMNISVARSMIYINSRENTLRCELDPGKYLVMPTTFDPNEEGEFLLRVISESSCELQKL